MTDARAEEQGSITVLQLGQYFEEHPEEIDGEEDEPDYEMAEDDDDEDEAYPIGDEVVDVSHPSGCFNPLVPSSTAHTISVDVLRQRIQTWREEGSVKVHFTDCEAGERDEDMIHVDVQHDAHEEMLDATVSICEWVRWVGTPLHYACADTDGNRGAEKIRIILEEAKRARVSPEGLLSMPAISSKYRYEHGEEVYTGEDDTHRGGSWTPLWILVNNCDATLDAAIELSQYAATHWPRVVFLRNEQEKNVLYALCQLLEREASNHFCEKIVAIIQLVLEIAAKSDRGAQFLIQVPTDAREFMRGEEWGEKSFDDDETPLHLVCETWNFLRPDKVISLLLKAWPDALHSSSGFLRYRGDGVDSYCMHPMHSVLCGKDTRPVRLLCASAFLEHSSLKSLAQALLFVDGRKSEPPSVIDGVPLFQLLLIHKDHVDVFKREDDPEMREKFESALRRLMCRVSGHGQTLLHYIAASSVVASQHESYHIEDSVRRSRILWGGERDFTEEELKSIIEQEAQVVVRNKININNAFRWFSSMHPGGSNALDNAGRNPFHYALSCGKTWDSGIQSLIDLNPEWPAMKDGRGLYPFMTAALAEPDADLTTVYELLRYVPQVVAPLCKYSI